MRQSCRYCSYCFAADDYRCSNHPDGKQPHWSEQDIKRENHCKNFALSDMGCVINGRQYKPREKKKDTEKDSFEQLTFLTTNF